MAQKNNTADLLRQIRIALTTLVEYLARIHGETIEQDTE